jgi:hypothetical protein
MHSGEAGPRSDVFFENKRKKQIELAVVERQENPRKSTTYRIFHFNVRPVGEQSHHLVNIAHTGSFQQISSFHLIEIIQKLRDLLVLRNFLGRVPLLRWWWWWC